MNRQLRGFLLAALTLLTACAGESTTEKQESCEGLSGHYDLLLSPPAGEQTTQFSLRLDDASGQCAASITPAGFPTVELVPRIESGSLILEDATGPALPTLTTGWYWGLHFYREYHFAKVLLERSSAGDFTGTATSNVEVMWAEDDICMVNDMEWSGSIGPDVTAPTLRAGGVSVRPPKRPSQDCFWPTGGNARPGLPAGIMPWEPLAVEASEPIAGLAGKLDVKLGGEPLDAPFVDTSLDEEASAKDVWVSTRLSDWDLVRGKQLAIEPQAGLGDAAGNLLVSTVLDVGVLDVGAALAAHELDDASTLATFGEIEPEHGALRVSAPCNSGVGGVAGRLVTVGATKVMLRVRVDAGTGILIGLTGSSGSKYDIAPPTVDLEWQDIPITISNESEVGFSVVPNSLCHWTSAATVWVDRVWSD